MVSFIYNMYMKIDEMIVMIRVESGVLPELVLILSINGIYSSEEKELA